jgi:hypothetical protein
MVGQGLRSVTVHRPEVKNESEGYFLSLCIETLLITMPYSWQSKVEVKFESRLAEISFFCFPTLRCVFSQDLDEIGRTSVASRAVRSTPLLRHSLMKPDHLPRQARDKHKET